VRDRSAVPAAGRESPQARYDAEDLGADSPTL